jgi:hypothetical protein
MLAASLSGLVGGPHRSRHFTPADRALRLATEEFFAARAARESRGKALAVLREIERMNNPALPGDELPATDRRMNPSLGAKRFVRSPSSGSLAPLAARPNAVYVASDAINCSGAGSDVPETEFAATMLAIFVIEYLFLVAWDVPRA